jgi:uncharacterized protein (DUF2249 family)
MNEPSPTIDFTHLDVRTIPCREKHARIFKRWSELPIGEHFVLVNDHDPVPLYHQFAAQFPGAFAWEYLGSGPDEFQVQITRLSDSPTSAPIAPPSSRGCQGSSAAATGVLDTRDLEPPEPLVRILAAVESLGRGAVLRAQTDRRPLHLYPELDARGLHYVTEEQLDGSWLTTIQRA